MDFTQYETAADMIDFCPVAEARGSKSNQDFLTLIILQYC